MLERALEALVAIAGREGSPVEVGAERHEGEVVIRVTGATPHPDPFAVPRKGTPSDPSGRALSLHAVDRAIEALGGTVAADDKGFVVRLPAAPPEGPAAADQAPARAGAQPRAPAH